MPEAFPLISVSGTHREMGRQHGEQAAEQVRGFVEYLSSTLKLERAALHERAMRFLRLFEKTCPHLVEEIHGLAEGAGIPFAEALAVQIRGELKQFAEEACTTFVISPAGTANNQILIGQNSDMPAEMSPFGYVLRVQPEDKPPAVMWTFGGQLGYHGINAHGVAHFANALGGGPDWQFALSHYPVKRMILEQQRLSDVVGLLREVPVCSNGNYVLCDGEGSILDVELTSEGPLLLEDAGRGFLAHSNHYLCAPYNCRENFDQSLPDSFPRLERMNALIGEKFGTVTLDDVKRFLSDHDNHPVSICRHPHEGYGDDILPASGYTVSSMIAEPQRGVLHVCRDNPCENEFVAYGLDN